MMAIPKYNMFILLLFLISGGISVKPNVIFQDFSKWKLSENDMCIKARLLIRGGGWFPSFVTLNIEYLSLQSPYSHPPTTTHRGQRQGQ